MRHGSRSFAGQSSTAEVKPGQLIKAEGNITCKEFPQVTYSKQTPVSLWEECPTKEAQSESLALGWTPACSAWQGGSMGRLMKRKGKDSQSEFSSPDVGCVWFFFRREARIKREV